ncbi:hypothetical protein GW17_00062233, partial [Ensete ventricosum]
MAQGSSSEEDRDSPEDYRGVAEKLVGSIEPSSDDEVGSHREFARRFAKGIGKLTGNTKGDRWTGGLVVRMLDYAG